MGIHIKKENDITITQTEYDQYLKEWEDSQRMTTNPLPFETWVRRNKIPIGCNNPSCFCTGRCKMTKDQAELSDSINKQYSYAEYNKIKQGE